MDASISNYILYVIFFILGYIAGEIGTKKLHMEVFLNLKILKKEYEIKIHHLYLSVLSLIPILLDAYSISLIFLGIGVHDAILEIRKKLTYRLHKI